MDGDNGSLTGKVKGAPASKALRGFHYLHPQAGKCPAGAWKAGPQHVWTDNTVTAHIPASSSSPCASLAEHSVIQQGMSLRLD